MLCVLVTALVPLVAAYPLGAPGHYGSSLNAWPPLSVYYPPRSTRPYYYLPQDPYYYPVVPSYYQRPYYYGYDEVTEPVEDSEEDMMGVEDRADSTYGQETYYQDSNDDVNARFLQNLILAQMYNDANKVYGASGYEESQGSDRWVYGEPVKSSRPSKTLAKEDEDVRELKSLVRGGEKKERRERGGSSERRERSEKIRTTKENPFAAQHKTNDWDEFRSSSYKRSGEARAAATLSPLAARGQKEEVLPRPAGLLRGAELFVQQTRAAPRQPSVFDTIKQLLHREEQLEEHSTGSRLQKRSYIPSEDSLVAQLGGLKKMA